MYRVLTVTHYGVMSHKHYPLPRPKIVHNLYTRPPVVRVLLKIRMWENLIKFGKYLTDEIKKTLLEADIAEVKKCKKSGIPTVLIIMD